tara:strand:- start:213 stop:818 length:606 start_codon:yes stop_codon:yes gene_type:complete
MPTAIYKDKLGYKVTSQQRDTLDNLVIHPNELSEEMGILDRPEFKSMKDVVFSHVKKYEKDVCGFKSSLSFKLTESWYRETVPGHNHPDHNHPNSMLSGVVYLNVPKGDESHEGINLIHIENRGVFKNHEFRYDYTPTKYNQITTFVPVETGDIVLFPSYLYHFVTHNESRNESRRVISFNTFIQGRMSCENTYPNVLTIK